MRGNFDESQNTDRSQTRHSSHSRLIDQHIFSENLSPGQVLPPAPDRITVILHLVMGCSSWQVHWPPPHPTYPAQSSDPSQAALSSELAARYNWHFLPFRLRTGGGLAGKVGTTHCTGPLCCWDELSCHWLSVSQHSALDDWLSALISLSPVLTTFLPRQSRAQHKTFAYLLSV